MRCPKCGAYYPSGVEYCDCGYNFTTGEIKKKRKSVSQVIKSIKDKIHFRGLFFISVFLMIIAGSAIYSFIFSLPRILRLLRFESDGQLISLMSIGLIIGYILILIELILGILGIIRWIKIGCENDLLLKALYITCFEYKILNVKFTMIMFELGFTFTFGQIGIGINFIGLVLLLWYLRLRQQKTKETGVLNY